jgi:flavin reductase (DIM6/NTAB) family NADH-FMN oxidoreductase RutF
MPPLQTLDVSSGFRNAMRRLATTVSVVTCADEDGWHGMTTTAVASVCTEPPPLLVCVNRATAFYGRLSAAGNFCINLLGAPHVQISQAFGGRLKGVEKRAPSHKGDGGPGASWLAVQTSVVSRCVSKSGRNPSVLVGVC